MPAVDEFWPLLLSNPVLFASGTTTPTIGSETFLSSPNVAASFALVLDTVNMVAGDGLQIRGYQMTLTGGTTRVVYYAFYDGAQPADDLIKDSDVIVNDLTDVNAVRFSIKQTLGATGRAFPWKVFQY